MTHRTMSERSYHGATSRSVTYKGYFTSGLNLIIIGTHVYLLFIILVSLLLYVFGCVFFFCVCVCVCVCVCLFFFFVTFWGGGLLGFVFVFWMCFSKAIVLINVLSVVLICLVLYLKNKNLYIVLSRLIK